MCLCVDSGGLRVWRDTGELVEAVDSWFLLLFVCVARDVAYPSVLTD